MSADHADAGATAGSGAPEAGETGNELPEQMRIRRAKYDRLMVSPDRAPFPPTVERTHELAGVRDKYPDLAAGAETGDVVAITGRVIFVRNTGRLCFATLREGGVELQIMLSAAQVGESALAEWKAFVDLGDQVFVRGAVIASKRGELSVLADYWRMTAKALRPLPVAHRALSEETRVRQRYVDLIVRPEARRIVMLRADLLRSLRATLHDEDYLELETPILQTVRGGAAARSFETHLNAFDLDMTLRIALELPLKRAIVGGLGRVYEIGRNFRNEGVDSTHSPEFTMLEAYAAYGDYDTMAVLARRLVLDAAANLDIGGLHAGDGTEIDLFGEWRSVTVHDAVSGAVDTPITPDTDVATLTTLAERHAVALKPGWTAGEIVLELFEKLVEDTLIQPTFVRDYPVEVRPLARQHRDDPRLTEAWDLVVGGVEVGVAYTELADPVEQRRRLVEQSLAAAAGDAEAMELDEDFLLALEHGMPPTGGLGMGVDRLLMLLSGRSVRDTILFPLLKPAGD